MEINVISTIRELASKFSHEDIEKCIKSQLNNNSNICLLTGNHDDKVSILSKSSFVRELMKKGKSLPEALRELGARMRKFSG